MTTRTKGLALGGALALLSLGGCAGMGTLGQVLGGMGVPGSGSQVEGTVRWVDTQRQQLAVQPSYGQQETLRYDANTVVYYQQRQYSVRDLEPGDQVQIQVQSQGGTDVYAQRIDVVQSAASGSAGGNTGGVYGNQVQYFQGRVQWVDTQRGQFGLETSSNGYGTTYTVSLPYNPSAAVSDRFRRLRTGDSVQIDGQLLNQNRIELVDFR